MDVTSIAPTYEAPVTMPSSPQTPASGSAQPTSSPQTGGITGNAEANEKTSSTPVVKAEADKEKEKEKTAASKPSQDMIEKTIEQINKSITTFNREMHVSVHEKTKRIMVKVMDTDENKVIREVPPEKVLDAFARTLELAGIIVDKKS